MTRAIISSWLQSFDAAMGKANSAVPPSLTSAWGELCAVANEIPNSLSILEFVCADKGLIVHEEVADEAIVNSVCEVADPDEQRPEQPEKTTSPQDVLHAFDTICTLFGEHDDNMAMNYFLRFESRDIKSLHGDEKAVLLHPTDLVHCAALSVHRDVSVLIQDYITLKKQERQRKRLDFGMWGVLSPAI
ncbi:hypothetical protein HPB51_001379 [Rhipicephalus microplus]|uniref:Uncharacterized protein n=1 Tax=Rhipicephalus microplus TaxID=6941 RepID=A0A9J6EEG6_RHIMP|nr:hypothetical protein HPB51_001379 [Rhipicephalus microplus]